MFVEIGYNIIILYAFFVVKNDDIALGSYGFLVIFYRGRKLPESKFLKGEWLYEEKSKKNPKSCHGIDHNGHDDACHDV